MGEAGAWSWSYLSFSNFGIFGSTLMYRRHEKLKFKQKKNQNRSFGVCLNVRVCLCANTISYAVWSSRICNSFMKRHSVGCLESRYVCVCVACSSRHAVEGMVHVSVCVCAHVCACFRLDSEWSFFFLQTRRKYRVTAWKRVVEEVVVAAAAAVMEVVV